MPCSTVCESTAGAVFCAGRASGCLSEHPFPERIPGRVQYHGLTGIFSVWYAGAEAHRYLSGEFSNGAGILVATAHEYLGAGGTAILSAIIILACLTTSIGLIAAIADYFHILFNQKLSKKTMGFLVALLSFLLSNFGLDMIIKMAIPVLCFLYPVMIALALLNVFGFGGNKRVFRCTMWIEKLMKLPLRENIIALAAAHWHGFITFCA